MDGQTPHFPFDPKGGCNVAGGGLGGDCVIVFSGR